MKTSPLPCSLALIIALVGTPSLAAEPLVRVRLFAPQPTVEVELEGPWRLGSPTAGGSDLSLPAGPKIRFVASDGRLVLEVPEGDPSLMPAQVRFEPLADSSSMTIRQVPYGVGWWWESKQDRRYSSTMDFGTVDGGVHATAVLGLEKYLQGVVPSEIGSDSPMEALKAQAVAARSETVRALETRMYAGPDYDICADVQCQAYSGDTRRSAASDQAIAETASLVLKYDGEVIGAYYASNSGGMTENVENVWPDRSGPVPYWSGVYDGYTEEKPSLADEEAVRAWIDSSPDVYSNPEFHPGMPEWAKKNFRWDREFNPADVAAEWGGERAIGHLVAIEPIRRGVSGRIVEARIVGTEGSFTVNRELALRQLFRPPLRSSCFYTVWEGPEGAPTALRIIGAGYGHGVGMCQTGAITRAIAGQDFRQILTHYYQGSEVVPAYD